jgi:site-specific DNA recombinase
MSEARVLAPRVTVVPATLNRFTAMPISTTRKRRVAAYARVSTNSEEQQTSYDAQVGYYTEYIQSNPAWEFVNVYADKGITGTNTKKRERFNDMIQDALDGKIDLIITKSVSRFARNTVDSLQTIRMLKERGVEVYFEEQNIYTLDTNGELLITIMSSVAQEESRSISENVTWGMRKRFAAGKVSMPYKRFLGYRKGEDGLPEIVEEEAKIVLRIYRLFLEGKTPYGIGEILMADDIPSPAGKKKWQAGTILSILTNEKYKGDAILQKTFCTDFLNKTMKVNEGEVPQYYIENSHPAIVSVEIFEMVQHELARRKMKGGQHNGTNIFSGKIICGCCTGTYGSKVWHSNDKYRRVIWQCNAKFKDGNKCDAPHLTEDSIRQSFLKAYNRLLADRQSIARDFRVILEQLTDTKAIETEAVALREEMAVVDEMIRQVISQNASTALNQAEYQQRYEPLSKRYEKAATRVSAIEAECAGRKAQRHSIEAFLDTLMKSDEVVSEFSPTIWNATVDRATVSAKGNVTFTFRNQMELCI